MGLARWRTICKNVIGAETFLALIAGQFERDHRDAQIHAFGQTGGVILNQFGSAGGADDQCLGGKRATASWQAVLNKVAVSPPRSRA